MTYLALRTDSPQAELYLYEGEREIAREVWQADRRLALELLGHLEAFLHANNKSFSELSGLLAYRGPGSFTGLRIGITVLNTMSYAQTIPIVGETGDDWLSLGIGRLENGENDQVVLPEYGAEARITKPKK
jgi:tRNA threonylcarbamoyladenosine biosynthesis protein TsaB